MRSNLCFWSLGIKLSSFVVLNICLNKSVLNITINIITERCTFTCPLPPSLLLWGVTPALPLLPLCGNTHTHTSPHTIHTVGTCWVDTWLTTAEQRAGPPITEQKACGLAPLVKVSAAPCPPSQKQGNGLCYSSLLTLQQIPGLVYSQPRFPVSLSVCPFLPLLSVVSSGSFSWCITWRLSVTFTKVYSALILQNCI